MLEADIREIVFLVKHLPGQHDQSTHGNRFKIINGKPKKIHIGGQTGVLNYDTEGNPLIHGPELPPKKEPKPKTPKIGKVHKAPKEPKEPKIPKPKKEPKPKAPEIADDDPSVMDNKSLIARSLALDKQMSDWKASLTPQEHHAISIYTGNKSGVMNTVLREDIVDKSWYKGEIDAAQSALLRGSLKTPITVYRGISVPESFAQKIIESMSTNIGEVFTDKAFVSTSINENKAFGGNIQLKIIVPKGTKGAYIKSISQHSDESEYLLPHHTKFKVLKYEKNSFKHTFTLQAIPK